MTNKFIFNIFVFILKREPVRQSVLSSVNDIVKMINKIKFVHLN